MTIREFVPSEKKVQIQAEIDIAAPPARVAAIYRDVKKWAKTFPATIERARIIETGQNWQQIEVMHKLEVHVPNTLIFLSDTEIGLKESKKKFDASFLNQFNSDPGGATHYIITSYVDLKGIYKLLKPFIEDYVHRQALKQMEQYVLEPLKTAAEEVGP